MTTRRAAIGATLRNPWCRRVFAAQLVSGLGDWAGRLALSVLVYERSDSALLAALTIAVTLVPWLGPGQLLATSSERFGRVQVMRATDLVRGLMFAVMAAGPPLPVLLVLAFVAGLCVPPFAGARASALVEITDEETYPSAVAVYAMIAQAEMVLGYVVGGALVATIGAQAALGANAVTFVVSAAVLSGLAGSPAAAPNRDAEAGWRGVAAGVRPWRTDPVCRRALMLFVGVSACSVLPEAIVVPFVDSVGGAPGWAGPIAAVVALGAAFGTWWMPLGGDLDRVLIGTAWRVGAAAAAAAVMFVAWSSLPVLVVAYAVTGLVDAVTVPTNQVVGRRLPPEGRAAAITVALGVQNTAHVVSITLAGLVADVTSPRLALAAAMTLAALVCGWSLVRPIRTTVVADAAAVP